MNFHFKKYVSVISGALLLASLPITSWALDNNYGVRTINKDITASQLEHKAIDGYNFIFSAAFVTKGAWGYDNPNNFTKLITILEKAQKEKELTSEGANLLAALLKLKPKILANPNDALTMTGINSVNQLGTSYAQTRKNLLLSHKTFDNNIDVLFAYDGSNISLKTGEQFVLGLIKSFTNDKIQIEYIQDEQPDVLAYYESREFRDWVNSYPDTHRLLGKIKYSSQQKSNQIKNYVDNINQRIFKKKFLNSVNGNSLIIDSSRVEPRDIVDYIFEIYKFLPSINIQEANDFNTVLDDIMRNEERRQFSAIDNANLFTTVGPSVTGQIQTTEQGRRLFNDLHITLQDFLETNDEPVKLYFIDPRALLSFLTLLEGSKLGNTLGPNEDYSYTADTFKVGDLAPLNSILIFDFYKNRDNKILVKINHNGKILTLKDTCQSLENTAYNWEDLAKCLTN